VRSSSSLNLSPLCRQVTCFYPNEGAPSPSPLGLAGVPFPVLTPGKCDTARERQQWFSNSTMLLLVSLK